MKWFGIDYRYVIAAAGAVFILWYEGSAPVQEEPQAEQAKEKPQPTQSNIEALKGINDKLAELLKNHGMRLRTAGPTSRLRTVPDRFRSNFLIRRGFRRVFQRKKRSTSGRFFWG